MVSHNSAKEEIKRAADIVEVIGQYVQLKKAGRNFVGLCPFHGEKDPSFNVSPERQMFHCFGCKKGGDIFAFWMEYHGVTFTEALKDLAERYQITIDEPVSATAERQKAALREALFKINEMAAAFFQAALKHPANGKPARAYLEKRSMTEKIISEFRLGYAPNEWDALTGVLRRHKVNMDLAVQAGLVVPRKSAGYYDRFRGRIIFPIFNLRQQVVGFGGRVLDDALPKYLNTPETPIFRKGETPYGLHASTKAIREKQRVLIVEGYMDLLALWNHGVNEVVATLGTALTAAHVRRLKGYAKEAIVVFDSDEAGTAAALKSLPIFLNEGFTARAVVLPRGHDPDTFVNAEGSDRFRKVAGGASPMFDFFLEQKLSHHDGDIESKVHLLGEILPVLSALRRQAQRALYVERLSERIGIKEDVIWTELRSLKHNTWNNAREKELARDLKANTKKKSPSDFQLLNLLLHYPETISRLMACDCKILLSDPVVAEIIDAIYDEYCREGECQTAALTECLKSETACLQLREALLEPCYYSGQEVELALAEFERKAYQKKILTSIQEARKKGDTERLVELTKLKAQGLKGNS